MTDWARRVASAPERERIVHGWQICATAPGRFATPGQLGAVTPDEWLGLPAPAPVAAALRLAGRWSLDGAARRFDAEDWWYRAEFQAPPLDEGDDLWLGFDGLATVADVWLNGELLLQTADMFVAHEVAVRRLLRRGTNTLVMCFRALDALLGQRRPRPRWRAPMVEHQQLRWFRTTLLGRTPGWSPPAAVVGPWRDVWLERRNGLRVRSIRLQPSVADGTGTLAASCALQWPPGWRIDRVELELQHAGGVHRTALAPDALDGTSFGGSLSIADVALWWPHTHGDPALYRARLRIHPAGMRDAVELECGAIGFRTIELDTAGGGFALKVNGVPVFCRGACWMPLDAVSLRAEPQACREAIEQVRGAGMNMLRVSGATVYEEAAFFDACDELGVLVWQDFMFANMDYPDQDADFMASVRSEVEQQLALWQGRPSLAVLCGNSEGEQQAAMWGAPRELWSPALFHATLRQWAQDALPDLPYWPSSAHGGSFPHQGDTGTTSYYGVGAYMRPLTDARRSRLSFATECLAFANMPEESTIARMPDGLSLHVHHATWRARAPRDHGAGWDFEDVRDHYLGELFHVDPPTCRRIDHERYLALSRVTSGEVMASAFAEWRRPGSGCGGALVWFLRDLWAGAGWGLVDDAGVPKACFHYLRRALQPVSVSITDEGGNGLVAHVVNERAAPLAASLEITLFGSAETVVSRALREVRVEARGALSVALGECFEGFLDLSYAYRFGPPPATLVQVRLCGPDGAVLSEAFFFPPGLPSAVAQDVGLTATLQRRGDGVTELVVATQRFAQAVHIELEGCTVDDNYFHLTAGAERRIHVRSAADRPLKGRVSALNADRSVDIREPS
jgi:beta-mannosidase